MRIIQMVPTLAYGDAIGNHVFAIDKILREEGYETAIIAENISPRLDKSLAVPLEKATLPQKNDLVLYHGSIGSKMNDYLRSVESKKVMIYHNITPWKFFKGYSEEMKELAKVGELEVRKLARVVDRCIAVSEFNKKSLINMGFSCPIDVCPILIPYSDYDKQPNQNVFEKYNNNDEVRWLFVGRIAPNKKQEDIISSFYIYQKKYKPYSRLFIIGNNTGMERYGERLKKYVKKLGIEDKVEFLGHISFEELLSYYQLANVFVCMSEHEGFCVPLIESMYFSVPIVAYRSSAIPETLSDSGIIIDRKDPEYVAAIVNRIIKDSTFRKKIIKVEKKRLEYYAYKNVKDRFLQCLQSILENNMGDSI